MLHQIGICGVLEDGSRLGTFMVFLNKISSVVGCIVLLWEASPVRERFLKATSVFKWVVCEYTEPRIPLKIDKEQGDELFSAPDSGLCGVNENFYLFLLLYIVFVA